MGQKSWPVLDYGLLQVKNYVALIRSGQIFFERVRSKLVEWGWGTRSGLSCAALHACLLLLPLQFQVPCFAKRIKAPPWPCLASTVLHGSACIHPSSSLSAEHFLLGMLNKLRDQPCTNSLLTFGKQSCMFDQNYNRGDSRHKPTNYIIKFTYTRCNWLGSRWW